MLKAQALNGMAHWIQLGARARARVCVRVCEGSVAKGHAIKHTHNFPVGQVILHGVSLRSHTGEQILSNQELKSKSFLRDCNATG